MKHSSFPASLLHLAPAALLALHGPLAPALAAEGGRLAAAPAAAPAPAQAAASPWTAAVQQLWATYSELRRQGRLENDFVAVFPVLDAKTHASCRASERLVEQICRQAPAGARLVYGPALKAALAEYYRSPREYQAAGDALRLAKYLECGFVVSGRFDFVRQDNGERDLEVQVLGSRPWAPAIEFDSGTLYAHPSDPLWEAVGRARAQLPDEAFGADDSIPAVVFGDEQRRVLLSRCLTGATTAFERRVQEALAADRIELDDGLQSPDILVLPPMTFDGKTNALSDTLESQIRKVCGNARSADQMDGALRQRDECLAWYIDDPDTRALAALGLRAVVQTRFRLDYATKELELEFTLTDAQGRSALSRTYIAAAAFEGLIDEQMTKPASLQLDPLPIDGLSVLHDAIRSQLAALVQANAGLLKGRTVRINPVTTPSTRAALERFHDLRRDLVDEAARVREAAAKIGIASPDEAWDDPRFPVHIATLQADFPTWNSAHGWLFCREWSAQERSKEFEQGRALRRGLETAFSGTEAVVQTEAEALGTLEPYLRDSDDTVSSPDGRSGERLAAFSSFTRHVPQLAVAIEIDRLERRLYVRARLFDANDAGRPFGALVEEQCLRGPRAERAMMSVPEPSSGRESAPHAPKRHKLAVGFVGRGSQECANSIAAVLRYSLAEFDVGPVKGLEETPRQDTSAAGAIEIRYSSDQKDAALAVAAELEKGTASHLDSRTQAIVSRFGVTLVPVDVATIDDGALILNVRL